LPRRCRSDDGGPLNSKSRGEKTACLVQTAKKTAVGIKLVCKDW
jgi:hypothetical protein